MSDRSLDILFVRSCVLAQRVADGELAFLDAVDLAYSAADWAGLVQRVGDDAVQQILAEAFIGVPRGAR
jgi:hypothetical protein